MEGLDPNVLVHQSDNFLLTLPVIPTKVSALKPILLVLPLILHSFSLSIFFFIFFYSQYFFLSPINHSSHFSSFIILSDHHKFFLAITFKVTFLYHHHSHHLVISSTHHTCSLCSSPQIWPINPILTVTSSLFPIFSHLIAHKKL